MKKDKDRFAPYPPMGWNSWDCYMSAVTEAELLENARYQAEHLLPYGWEYITCDIQWYEPTAGTRPGCEYIPFAPLCMDGYGRLIPAENRFPSSTGGKGFAPIAAELHRLGLKFGIHIMRGIPRQAVYARTPVLNSGYTADQIADPSSICLWNSDMFGTRKDHPGAQAYYDSLFELYTSWGVDFVKVDDIANTGEAESGGYAAAHEIEMIRRAIDRCGRAIVLSLSPGPASVEKAWHLSQNANMWRITNDFWDDWALLKNMFTRCEIWQSHVGPGCWPDCDMLPLGRIGVKFGQPRQTRFTPDEQKTLLTLWSIFRSPLILGAELPSLDEATLRLLTNRDVLRLNRHSFGARQIVRDDAHAVWVSQDEDGSRYAALFNLSEKPREVSLELRELEGEAFACRGALVRRRTHCPRDTFLCHRTSRRPAVPLHGMLKNRPVFFRQACFPFIHVPE
ncbi:MAG: alpha-galactosidase [Lachnospiraceae bacterium]